MERSDIHQNLQKKYYDDDKLDQWAVILTKMFLKTFLKFTLGNGSSIVQISPCLTNCWYLLTCWYWRDVILHISQILKNKPSLASTGIDTSELWPSEVCPYIHNDDPSGQKYRSDDIQPRTVWPATRSQVCRPWQDSSWVLDAPTSRAGKFTLNFGLSTNDIWKFIDLLRKRLVCHFFPPFVFL